MDKRFLLEDEANAGLKVRRLHFDMLWVTQNVTPRWVAAEGPSIRLQLQLTEWPPQLRGTTNYTLRSGGKGRD